MRLSPIKLAVKQFVQDNPNWCSEYSKDEAVAQIFSRTVTPFFGRLLNAITGGLYDRLTKKEIKYFLNEAIYHRLTGRVTFHTYKHNRWLS